MHILLDARTAIPHFPGIGRYAGELATALAERLKNKEGRLTVIVPPVCTFPFTESDRCRTVVSSQTPLDPRQQSMLKEIVSDCRPDLYHSPYYLMPTLRGLPTVLTMHDCIPLMQPAESSSQERIQFRTCAARSLDACDSAIAVSETTRTDCARFFPESARKFTTIPHGVHQRYTPCSTLACTEFPSRYGFARPMILYLGSNRPHKNIAGLLSGYAHARPLLKGHGLVIAGYGSEKTRREEAILIRTGIDHDVAWLGPISEEDMPTLFSCATAFAFPSFYEGFGLPVLEALATGTPVACSDTSSLRELCGETALYFDPHKPASIAQALVTCVSNESSRKRMIAAGLERASRYRWKLVADATWDVYKATLAQFRHSTLGARLS